MNNNTLKSEWIIRSLTIGLIIFVFTELNNNNYYSEPDNTIDITAIYQLDNSAIAINSSLLPHTIGNSQHTDNCHLQLKTYNYIGFTSNLYRTKYNLQTFRYLNIKPIIFSIHKYNTLSTHQPSELPIIA